MAVSGDLPQLPAAVSAVEGGGGERRVRTVRRHCWPCRQQGWGVGASGNHPQKLAAASEEANLRGPHAPPTHRLCVCHAFDIIFNLGGCPAHPNDSFAPWLHFFGPSALHLRLSSLDSHPSDPVDWALKSVLCYLHTLSSLLLLFQPLPCLAAQSAGSKTPPQLVCSLGAFLKACLKHLLSPTGFSQLSPLVPIHCPLHF